jgi:acetate kinase
VLVDAATLAHLAALAPLAPLHQPHNVSAIEVCARLAPDVPQVACFDTAFHRTQPEVAQAFPLPAEYADRGIRRYGFHGLSCEYVASTLARIDVRAAAGRTIVAHLGSGASMCALHGKRSVATTMGFSPLDGLMMGTRCGAIDPGVLLYLLDHDGMSRDDLQKLLYEQSGLLGVSGMSGDMRTLLASPDPRAGRAIDLFVYRAGRELGSLTAALGGLDAIVFTGGIGEHSPAIRARICRGAAWLGVQLDEDANRTGGPRLTHPHSQVSVWVIPTNEEEVIARHTRRLAAGARPSVMTSVNVDAGTGERRF